MSFGETIKTFRKQSEMTQEQLAELLSISPQAVSRWETNTAMPDISLLPPLANLFGVSTDFLLGMDDFQRTVFRAQALEVAERADNDDRKEDRDLDTERKQVAADGRRRIRDVSHRQHPYLEQHRAFILNILKICPQTQATNIMYRVKDQFPDFNCRKTTFFRYIHDLREQTGYVKPEQRPTSFRGETPPGYEAQVDFGQFKIYLEKNSDNCSHLAFGDTQISTTFLRERV
ncbi:MAG: helix-turn-helix transcriptional regulator [Clostridia bacterium]|nr:helix-turn-helix transcriptional regulator [Clostridia bacterium]